MKTTWEVIGNGPDTRVWERRLQPGDKKTTYEEAKQTALRDLEDHVRPYLKRIDELKSDEFRQRGMFPKMKAWHSNYVRVIAKTKKRAAEMMKESRYSFNLDYSESVGDSWYPYAADESVWIITRKAEDDSIQHQRALPSEEAEALLRKELAEFEVMPLCELLEKVGNKEVREVECSKGLPVRVEVKVNRYGWDDGSNIYVNAEITNRVFWPVSCSVKRNVMEVEEEA